MPPIIADTMFYASRMLLFFAGFYHAFALFRRHEARITMSEGKARIRHDGEHTAAL